MNPEVFENCSTILLDIAGTVGSINFTKDTLFAFAKKNIEEYLTAKWEDEEVKKLVAELKGDGEDLADVTKAVERFNVLTDENSINTGLKTLQGLLYKQGYENGELKAHVFDDIKTAFDEWSKNRKICIYSTGAEDAQKQYFSNSTAGDLSAFVAKYFDQKIGVKTAPESYESIAKDLEVKPQEMIFLTDDIEEVKAAQKAGCVVVLVTREGNAKIKEEEKKNHMVISSFADIPLSAKRKNQEVTSSEEPPAKVAKVDAEDNPEKEEEATEAMEVDSSISKEVDTEMVVEAKPVEAEDENTAENGTVESTTETPTEKIVGKEETTSETVTIPETDTPAGKGEKAPEPETTESVEEKKEDPAPVTENGEKAKAEVEKGDNMATTEKTEQVPETEKENAEPEKVESTTEETKSTEKKSEEAVATPETKEETEESDTKENGTENREAKKGNSPVEENGTNNSVDEKENKSEIANGASNTTETEKSSAEAESEEVRVKKIEDATEKVAPVTVEA